MYIFYEDKTKPISRVIRIIYDATNLTNEHLQGGVFVDTVPQPEIRANQMAVLYGNTLSNELWYEYVDVPIDNATDIEQRIADLEAAMAAILGGAVE